MWENRAKLWLWVVSNGLLWGLEAPVHEIAVSQLDVLSVETVSLTLEDPSVEDEVGSLKLVHHLVAVHHIGGDIPDLGRDLELNPNLVHHLKGLIHRFAVSSAGVGLEMLTEVQHKEVVVLVVTVNEGVHLLEGDWSTLLVRAPVILDLAHELH